MKAIIFSDIHDNYQNLTLMLTQLKELSFEHMFFLGDFVNAGIARTIALFPAPTYAIWGNNDGDRSAITRVAMSPGSNLSIAEATFDIVEFGGRRIFVTHYPLTVASMAKSGDYDAVWYGHDHRARIDRDGPCLIVNPGEISAHKTGRAHFAVYDSDTNTAELVEVGGPISTVFTDEVRDYRRQIGF